MCSKHLSTNQFSSISLKMSPNFTQTFYCKDLFSRTFGKKKDQSIIFARLPEKRKRTLLNAYIDNELIFPQHVVKVEPQYIEHFSV